MVYRFAEAAFECRHSFDKPKELLEMYAIACWKEPTARASTKQDQTQPVVVRGAKWTGTTCLPYIHTTGDVRRKF